VEEAFGNTVLMRGLFNDAVINTECVAQTFGCIFIVLQHAKLSITMKLHVCVHIQGVPQFMIHS